MIRLLVADESAGVRCGLRVLFAGCPDITLVGEAASGPAAVALAGVVHPDVVLMGVRIPGGDGLAATQALTTAQGSPPAVVITTAFDQCVVEALRAGACGFVPERAGPRELIAAVRLAGKGQGMLSPSVVRRIVAEFARLPLSTVGDSERANGGASNQRDAGVIAASAAVTSREMDVLQALATGLSDHEIAVHLAIELTTVKTHLTHLRVKTGSRNRIGLLLWAIETGLIGQRRR